MKARRSVSRPEKSSLMYALVSPGKSCASCAQDIGLCRTRWIYTAGAGRSAHVARTIHRPGGQAWAALRALDPRQGPALEESGTGVARQGGELAHTARGDSRILS